jgi:subtilisin-like proprotein convertase family protein
MRVLSGKHVFSLIGVAALMGAALVAISSSTAAAAGVPCQVTYSSGTVNVAIADNSTISSDINVPEDGLVVSDVDVTVNLHHTFTQDLYLSIFSYTDAVGLRAVDQLFNREVSNQPNDNMLGTVFNDEATTEIARGNAPYTGAFRPTRPLSQLDGLSGGFYRLVVRDAATGDSGTLNDWSVTLRYKSCDFDSDGVEDHGDACLQISAHTATGCPLTSRSLTAKYKHGKFRGALSSPVAGCKSHRSVTIWKVRSGADKKIGTATSRSDGTYRLTRAKHAGKYYATSPRAAVTDVAECPAAKSTTFRIR